MRKVLCLVVLALLSTAAQAQIKCWNDANGKRVCGDAPPAGVRTRTIQAPAAGAAPAAAAKDAKDAPKGPLTAAEREQDYRKRQQEAKKAADKVAAEEKEASDKRENCDRAKEALRTLESGQRIARTDSKGERYYLDESQVAQEVAKTRQAMQQQGCT